MYRVRSKAFLTILGMLLLGALGAGAAPASNAIGERADPRSEAQEGLHGKLTFRRATLGAPPSRAEVWMMNADGSEVQQVTCNNRDDVAPAWSPNGQTIAFYSNERRPDGSPIQNIYLVDVQDACAPGTLLTEGRFPSWSSDRRLVFDRGQLGDRDIWVRERDGTETQLTSGVRATRPDWSPDGTKIAFARGEGEDAEDIYVMNADGSDMKQLTSDPAGDNGPQWSPDGRKIVFQSDRDESPNVDEIYVMNADGTQQERLTVHPGRDAQPRWSPDGRHILFSRDTGDPLALQLFIMNPDGTGLRQVTDPPAANAFPDWGQGHLVPSGG